MKATLLFLPLFTLPLAAFTPVLSRVEPPGGQSGTEVEVRFHGERLDETNGALFYEPGLTLSGIQIKDGKLVTAKLAIAADAPPGEHSLRLTSPGGLTELRTFWVGAFPAVQETEPNGSTGPPQRIDLNRTVHGVAGNEDDDCYVVTLQKGQRLSAEVEAMRLGRTMFDASLAIIDARGFELATCDDAPLLRTDAFVSIIAPENGDYRIVVREAAYEGNDQCLYRLHIGTFPRPKAVFPTGGKPGETLEFTFIGDPSGPIRQSFTLPPEPARGFPVVSTARWLVRAIAALDHGFSVRIRQGQRNFPRRQIPRGAARASVRRSGRDRSGKTIRLVPLLREERSRPGSPRHRPQSQVAAGSGALHSCGGWETHHRQ